MRSKERGEGGGKAKKLSHLGFPMPLRLGSLIYLQVIHTFEHGRYCKTWEHIWLDFAMFGQRILLSFQILFTLYHPLLSTVNARSPQPNQKLEIFVSQLSDFTPTVVDEEFVELHVNTLNCLAMPLGDVS